MKTTFQVEDFGASEKVFAGFILLFYVLIPLLSGGGEPGSVNFSLVLMSANLSLCFAAISLVVLKVKGKDSFGIFGLDRGFEAKLIWKFLAGWAAVALGGLGVRMILEALNANESEAITFVEGSGEWSAIASLFFGVVVVVPVAEEIAFRGVLYGVLKKLAGSTPAMVASAVLFALAHNDFGAIPHFVGLSILMTWAFEKTGSLWAAIAIHAFNNLFVFGFIWWEVSGT